MDEIELFSRRASRCNFKYEIEKCFIAKTSGKSRNNTYLGGTYFYYDHETKTSYEGKIIAPKLIIDLVQWCSPDIIIMAGNRHILSLEDTTHLVGNNLFQRFPRLGRTAMMGYLAINFQSVSSLDFKNKSGDWNLARYYMAYNAINRIYKGKAFPITYFNNIEMYRKEKELYNLIEDLIANGKYLKNDYVKKNISNMNEFIKLKSANPAPELNSIEVLKDKVIVHIGVKPDKPSWKTKGSGQMDTYLGMIYSAKIIYCYDTSGNQAKPLVVDFKYLPKDFFWFRDCNNSLYCKLPKLFADEMRFNG
jgi:hypothetical protein